MSMYYLHRAGETTGPFAPGRIAAMITAGEVDEHDQVCAHGTEEWIPAYLVTGQQVEAAPRAPQPVARVKKRPFALLSWLFFLAGVAMFFLIPWIIGVPAGVVLILVAIAVDRPQWLCAGCGNRVEKTSTICPACRAPLATESQIADRILMEKKAARQAEKVAATTAKAKGRRKR